MFSNLPNKFKSQITKNRKSWRHRLLKQAIKCEESHYFELLNHRCRRKRLNGELISHKKPICRPIPFTTRHSSALLALLDRVYGQICRFQSMNVEITISISINCQKCARNTTKMKKCSGHIHCSRILQIAPDSLYPVTSHHQCDSITHPQPQRMLTEARTLHLLIK